MIQVGKVYNVAKPDVAVILGMSPVVKILRKIEGGLFVGDNDQNYLPDGRHVNHKERLLVDFNTFNLVSEADVQY